MTVQKWWLVLLLLMTCAIKPLTSSAAKWGKRLFVGCIPIEATVDNVQLYFSQFGYVLDVINVLLNQLGFVQGFKIACRAILLPPYL